MDAPWPTPPRDGVTLWHLSDSHIDQDSMPWTLDHLNEAAADIAANQAGWNIDAKIHTGDIVDDRPYQDGLDEDTAALTWLDANLPDPATDIWLPGNHDINDAGGVGRTRAQWEAVYGRSAIQSVLVGPADARMRVLTMCTDEHVEDPARRDRWVMSPATLSWLDAQLTADPTTPTWLACHYMLQEHGSYGADHKAQPEQDLVGLIADHPNVVGWLCGHAHWNINNPIAIQMLAVGGRAAFPSIQAPSTGLSAVGFSRQRPGVCTSLLVTYRGPDRIEVRFRDHATRCWVSSATNPTNSRVTYLTPA